MHRYMCGMFEYGITSEVHGVTGIPNMAWESTIAILIDPLWQIYLVFTVRSYTDSRPSSIILSLALDRLLIVEFLFR